ncbi:MAG TPA: hypothetical protein VGK93_04790 [Candidatus Eisenbacteria bacterium]
MALPLVHAWGAPLGEPVAEDFDFLHHLLFSSSHSLLDGGGSKSFWRPVAQQLYYRGLGGLMLSHPGLVAALHTLLLGLATLLFYRALRRVWPGTQAALAASFPILCESSRQLIAWPGHSADLGAWLFTAIAVRELSRNRLWTMLAALLAALLSKEVAVVAALALPWLPRIGPTGWRSRARWAGASGLLVLLWALAYLGVRRHAGLELPHGLEATATTLGVPLLERLLWAVVNSLRAMFSLPAAPVPWEGWVAGAIGVLVLAAAAFLLPSPAGRARLAAARSLALWGLAWFVAAAATLTPVHPFWAPNRACYLGIGFGVTSAAVLGACHPGLLAAFTLLRLGAFALSPGPPATVTAKPPDTGAFVDFQRLVRLQLLVRDTRRVLEERFSKLSAGSAVSYYYLPPRTEYAFGGDRALQVWYHDSTLRWLPLPAYLAHPTRPVVAFIEFKRFGHPQIALVEPAAMRRYLAAADALRGRDYPKALAELAAADSLQPGGEAITFPASVAGARAVCLLGLGRTEEALSQARRSLALWPESPDALLVLDSLARSPARGTKARK